MFTKLLAKAVLFLDHGHRQTLLVRHTESRRRHWSVYPRTC